MKTIVVLDTYWIGHIPTYHRLTLERLLSAGHRVISISPRPQELKWTIKDTERRAYFTEVQSFNIEETDFHRKETFRRAVNWWKNCRANIESVVEKTGWSPDLVFLPGVENNIISSALSGNLLDEIFPYKWAGLYLTPKYLRKSFFKYHHKRLFRKDRFFEAKNCMAVAVLDEGVIPRLKTVLFQKNVLVMPDFTCTEAPLETPSLALQVREAAQGRKIVGLLGELSSRKGLLTLLEIAEEAWRRQSPLFFAIAGPLNDLNNSPEDLKQLKEKIAHAPPNCFFHLERISGDANFNAVFKECDVIFASYKKFYNSSNIMTKAAAFEKPIIVSRGYCMAERVKKFGLGETVPEGDSKTGLLAIECVLKGETLDGRFLTPQYKQFFALNSLQKLDLFLEELVNLGGEIKNGEKSAFSYGRA